VTYQVLANAVTDTTSVSWIVSIIAEGSGMPDIGEICAITANVPIAQSTDFVGISNGWTGNQPLWGVATSFLTLDGINQSAPPDNQYGIDLNVQRLTISPDWDIIALSGVTGGGGGDSGAFPEVPDDGITYGRTFELWSAVYTQTEADAAFLPASYTPPTFTGAGTTGMIPDPVTEEGRILDDAGNWVVRTGTKAESFPSGLLDGGAINIVGGTDVQVIAGAAIIMDSYTNPLEQPTFTLLSWDNLQEVIVGAATPSVIHICMTDTGTTVGAPIVGTNLGQIVQHTSPPTPAQKRQQVYLGYVVYNGTEWQDISAPSVINATAHTLNELLNDVGGSSVIQSGGKVTEQSVPVFNLDMAEAVVFQQNVNWHTSKLDPHRETVLAKPNAQFKYTNRDFSTIAALTPTVDPTLWDNNGTVEAVGGGAKETTIQRLYLDPDRALWVLYGQQTYSNYVDAVVNIGTDTSDASIPTYLEDESILLGYIICERTETDWTPSAARFIPVIERSSSGASTAPTTFDQLTDTPADKVGSAKKVVAVNDAGDALIYSTIYHVEASGRIGIGVDLPTANLHVHDAGSGCSIRISDGTGGIGLQSLFGGQALFLADGSIDMYPFGTAKGRWSANGLYIGDGVDAAYPLEVAGDMNLLGGVYRIDGVPIGGGGGNAIKIVTASVTAVHNDELACNISAADQVITLPTTPSTDDWVRVFDIRGNWESNIITVEASHQIADGLTSFHLDVDWGDVMFVFNGTNWEINPDVIR
ncbi:MAG: hypothetical protein DRI46_12240, partial [Chloroflexi bacterium]